MLIGLGISGPLLSADYHEQAVSLAMQQRWPEIYNLIDERKVDVNEKNKISWALLEYAITFENIEAVKELLNRDAEVNIVRDYGNTPIMDASKFYLQYESSDITLIKLLLSKGANPNLKNFYKKNLFKFIEHDRVLLASNQRRQELIKLIKELIAEQSVPQQAFVQPQEVVAAEDQITLSLPIDVSLATGKESMMLDLNENETFTMDSFKNLINQAGTKHLVIAISQDDQHNWYFHVFDAAQFTTYSGTQVELIDPINRQEIKYVVPVTLKKDDIQ